MFNTQLSCVCHQPLASQKHLCKGSGGDFGPDSLHGSVMLRLHPCCNHACRATLTPHTLGQDTGFAGCLNRLRLLWRRWQWRSRHRRPRC